nr:MAG TPA: hypothetical protein [Caudoviricetes sp.]
MFLSSRLVCANYNSELFMVSMGFSKIINMVLFTYQLTKE